MSEPKASCGCSCSTGPTLIFACSGAADVGAISDQAARNLTVSGAGKMFCLAGVGGRVPLIMENTRAAGKIVAIDGCDKDCAKQTLLQAGFTKFAHVQLSALGMEKGKSPVTAERIGTVAAAAKAALA